MRQSRSTWLRSIRAGSEIQPQGPTDATSRFGVTVTADSGGSGYTERSLARETSAHLMPRAVRLARGRSAGY
jgi:hypothetical protein